MLAGVAGDGWASCRCGSVMLVVSAVMQSGWGDESGSIPSADPGSYIMAIAVLEDKEYPLVCRRMMDVILPHEKKVHWHGRDRSQRMQLCELVSNLPLMSIVVVHHQVGARERRHRRKCLESLFPLAAGLGCANIVLESRGGQDASDFDTLQTLRAQKVVTGDLRLDHRPGRDEPALWVADIVCGAVVQSRVGHGEFLEKLAPAVDIYHV